MFLTFLIASFASLSLMYLLLSYSCQHAPGECPEMPTVCRHVYHLITLPNLGFSQSLCAQLKSGYASQLANLD